MVYVLLLTSLGKLIASQQVFIATSRICIIGLGLLDEQSKNKQTKNNQVSN